jgi:hypothetical protein
MKRRETRRAVLLGLIGSIFRWDDRKGPTM